QRDVRAIARELGRSEFDVAKTLFGLESAGVVVLADPGTLRRERTSGATDLAALVGQAEEALARKDVEAARAMAEQAGSLYPHDPVVHLPVGRAHLAAGRAADAGEELRRGLMLDPRRKRSPARERGSMADEIKTLSAELARDPQSLVFLRLGDLLRQRGQLDAAHRVALNGLERHPHLADAHDLYARLLADKRDYERAFDEWDMARRIAPGHMGALKGLAFLYFKVGDVAQAVAHLEEAE